MKSKIDQDIKNATDVLKEVMKDNLSLIAADIVKKVMRNYKKLIYSMRFNATKDITPMGLLRYKQELLTAMAVISADAVSQARKEVPKAKKVKFEEVIESIKLGEFENLPASMRIKLQAKADLLINTQLADLEKAIYFQYSSSVAGTEKLASTDAQIEAEIANKAEDYIDGASIEAGAGVTGANTINEARNAFFFEDDVLAEIEAFEFVNGDPVSPICQSLAGIIFAKDDPNIFLYQPPLHYRCKSYIVPILTLPDGTKIEDLSPRKVDGYSNEQVMKSLQFSESIKDCSCFSKEGTFF